MSGTFEDLKRQVASEPQKVEFIEKLGSYLIAIGSSNLVSSIPMIGSRLLDLCDLYSLVVNLGGIDIVNREGKWDSICSKLGVQIQNYTVISNAYMNLLSKFEYRNKPQAPTTGVVGTTQRQQIQHQQQQHHQPQRPYTQSINLQHLQTHQTQQVNESMALANKIANSIRDLDSSDPYILVRALNFLTQKSFELTDSNAIQFDTHPNFVLHLGSLLDAINPLGRLIFDDFSHRELVERVLERVSSECFTILPSSGNNTFLVSNEQVISSSTPIMRHVSSILLSIVTNPLPSFQLSEAAHLALDIACNIGSRVDVTGRRRIQHHVWLEDTLDPTFNRSLQRIRLSPHISEATTTSYIAAVSAIFPFCFIAIRQNYNRHLLIRGLEILGKLALVQENIQFFHRCPNSLLESIVDLLAVSTTTSDTLSLHESLSESRAGFRPFLPPAFVGASFYPDLSDLEVRDTAIETIAALSSLSPLMQVRLGNVSRCVPLLVRIIDMKGAPPVQQGTQFVRYRTDSMIRALDALKMLASRPENRIHFLSSFSSLISAAAGGDDQVAELVCVAGSPVFLDMAFYPLGNNGTDSFFSLSQKEGNL